MTRKSLPTHLAGLDSRAFSALVDQADNDYGEGRVAVDADGWIVSETEMLLRQTLAKPDSRRRGRLKKPSRA
ncbi:hypothetical protein ABUE31_06770 [Mesorhizobium sp. ZMM04-5]|uniref:Uncharacterized protein n=1 Tax=Mesorhizobium marinum TaxID=3228790 RepID=A0ABV3QXJ5_9HYPH